MKKKGFTLIELLAVIVILSIIAIIATPLILGVIEKSRKGSAEASVTGYIDALEKQILVNDMNSENAINNGTYFVSDIDVSIKGKAPKQGIVEIEKMNIKSAKLCIDGYSLYYDGEKTKFVDTDYCSEDFNITLKINETEDSKKIRLGTNTEFDITEDISSMTNVSCNNEAIPTLEGNKLKVTNIFGDTKCVINDSLEETIKNLDDIENHIILINDELNGIKIPTNKTVYLDLNGNKIESISQNKAAITNYGEIYITDTKGFGSVVSDHYSIVAETNSKTYIYGGKFESTSTRATIVLGSQITNNESIYIIGNEYNFETGQGIYILNSGSSDAVRSDGKIKNGSIFINGATIETKYEKSPSVRMVEKGTINICNAKIITAYKDLHVNLDKTGIINYSSNVIFTNGTNTPSISGTVANIIPNYTGTCLES